MKIQSKLIRVYCPYMPVKSLFDNIGLDVKVIEDNEDDAFVDIRIKEEVKEKPEKKGVYLPEEKK